MDTFHKTQWKAGSRQSGECELYGGSWMIKKITIARLEKLLKDSEDDNLSGLLRILPNGEIVDDSGEKQSHYKLLTYGEPLVSSY